MRRSIKVGNQIHSKRDGENQEKTSLGAFHGREDYNTTIAHVGSCDRMHKKCRYFARIAANCFPL